MPASLRALLERSIDYAGMFPPCSIELEPALKNQAEYVRSPDAWMLSTFVLPVAQFEAAEKSLSQFDPKHPLRISALGPKSETAAEFIAALKKTTEAIRSFQAQHVDLVLVVQLEMLLPVRAGLALNVDLKGLNEARSVIGDLKLQAFWEAPVDAAEETIDLLAAHNSKTKATAFGYKLRTGGVTADAFPVSIQIARALIAAAKHHVPIKFTAGLHHPVRQFRDEVQTKMHGFLNVLGAGVLAAEHQWNEQQTVAMLEDEDASAFSFHDTVFAWREWEITMDRIKARRKLMTSFGSCSFDEPREDLRALNFL
jgi:hypothetical protein